MLRLLAASSFRASLRDKTSGVELLALPKLAAEEFGFRGVCVCSDLLAGMSERALVQLREAGDKSACPCLALVETAPLALAERGERASDAAQDRLKRVVRAAHALGCSNVIVGLAASDKLEREESASIVERLAPRLRTAVAQAEKLELNFLLTPTSGVFAQPAILTATLKKVGGFRVGSAPDFEVAAGTEDPADSLRQLAPHATCAITASREFTRAGKHKGYDFVSLMRALIDLGYDGSLIVEYRGAGDERKGVAQTLALIDAVQAEASE